MQKCFFDIESTGLNISTDRIVQLAIRVEDEEGKVILNKAKLYNPGIHISESASLIHGIIDNDIKDCPSFADDTIKLKKIFENKIIITFNGMHFDIPLLCAEFERAGVELTLSGRFVDVLKLERKINAHTLSDTYERYTGKKLDDAHNALKDVEATEIVFKKQLFNLRLKANPKDPDKQIDNIIYEDMTGLADWSGKLKYDDKGYLIFNFGKNQGKRILDEPNYASWILNESFSSQVKRLIRKEQTRIIKGEFPTDKFELICESDCPF